VPRWLGRLLYAFRGKRRARFYLGGPGIDETLEGVLVGRWSGHYVVLLPRRITASGESVALKGELEIPAERVVFVQILR
jgi:hypothetical protein